MISKRLSAIAHMVKKGSTVFDIGADHGYLSIFLATTNKNKVIATDITDYSVTKITNNVNKTNLNNISVIKTDGLHNLNINKDDVIIISGMGCHTILKILNQNLDKLSNTLILQSNNNLYELRKNVCNLGYYIDEEKLVVENKKTYIIIKFIKGIKKYSYIDYLIGPYIKYNKKYLLGQQKKYNKMYKEIPKKYICRKIKVKYILFNIKKLIKK